MDVGPRRAAGVTLLELLIVLMIMAFVTAIVIPIFQGGVSNTQLRGAARALASGLRLARSEAVSQRRETFLVLDVANRRFKVDRDPQEHALPRDVELKLFTAQKDLVDDKVGSIRFYPDGGSNGGRITWARASANTKSTSTGLPAVSQFWIDAPVNIRSLQASRSRLACAQ